jgi:DNA-binding IclR family transcriptional regulator
MKTMAGEKQIKGPRNSLQDSILAYVTQCPGVKLSAIESGVGASRIEVAEAIHDLIRQGKLRKEEETREYYPFLWE